MRVTFHRVLPTVLLAVAGFVSCGAREGLAADATKGPFSKLVAPGSDGKLKYASEDFGHIPDYSYCGYAGGGVALPSVPAKAEVTPDSGDCEAKIQAAIDKVAALPMGVDGFRGAVLLKRGTYRIGGTIQIADDGVVLRGEGSGEKDTVLLATGAKQRAPIVVGAAGRREAARNAVEIAEKLVPLGAMQLTVKSPDAFKVNDSVIVERPSQQNWFDVLGMNKLTNPWQPGSKNLKFARAITAIDGNRITLDAPLGNEFQAEFGGGTVYKYTPDRVRHVAVENLRGDSEYKDATDENHGWVLIDFKAVEDGWAKDVASIHFGYSCVQVHAEGRRITIEDCQCLDPISQIIGGRRYSFALDGQLTLVQRCFARNGRHDFVMHALACGPNAFVDCKAELSHADSGPHHRWSCSTLFDNVSVSAGESKQVSGGELNVRNRGNSGTGHGWAGAYMVFWNCRAGEITCEKPPTAQNFAIGCTVATKKGDGWWESVNAEVWPRSLYYEQLKDRLGAAALSRTAADAPRPAANMTPLSPQPPRREKAKLPPATATPTE